jgi:hypothetical protein
MRVLSPTASRLDHIICPFCESGLCSSLGDPASPAATPAGCRCSALHWRPCGK